MARRHSQEVAKSKGPWSTNTCSVAPIDAFQVVELCFFPCQFQGFFQQKKLRSRPGHRYDVGPFRSSPPLKLVLQQDDKTSNWPGAIHKKNQELWQLPSWSPVFTWPQTVWSMNLLVQILRPSVFSFVLDWEIYWMHASNHIGPTNMYQY